VQTLARALNENCTLTTLDLGCVFVFLLALKCGMNVDRFVTADNAVGAAAAVALAGALTDNCKLTTLNLQS
jgi:hypothetical protein